jgi:Spy/CpxP family protein refolding chaperone
MIKKRADLLIAEMELGDVVHKEPVDMAAAEAKIKYIESLRSAIFLAHIRAFQEIKSILTPEQNIKLKGMITRHLSGSMGRMKDRSMKKEIKSGPTEK